MAVEIRELRPDDYDKARRLWQSLSSSENNIRKILSHQTGLSIVACQGDEVIGTVLCCYDEHGYQYHVAVCDGWANTNLAREMVNKAIRRFMVKDRKKCHVHLTGQPYMNDKFWQGAKWCPKADWAHYPTVC